MDGRSQNPWNKMPDSRFSFSAQRKLYGKEKRREVDSYI